MNKGGSNVLCSTENTVIAGKHNKNLRESLLSANVETTSVQLETWGWRAFLVRFISMSSNI